MVPTKAALFQLFSARMRFLGQREVVLGQNVANADTPAYRPRDLSERAFVRLVEGAAGGARLTVAQTRPGHLEGSRGGGLELRAREVDSAYEQSPDGNAVVLEEQMAALADTAMDYRLTANLYRKYAGMVRTALGGQG